MYTLIINRSDPEKDTKASKKQLSLPIGYPKRKRFRKSSAFYIHKLKKSGCIIRFLLEKLAYSTILCGHKSTISVITGIFPKNFLTKGNRYASQQIITSSFLK